MARSQPLSIRLGDVTATQSLLEHALGFALDRYEPTSERSKHYAQIDVAEAQDYWSAALKHIQAFAPKLRPFLSDGSVGSARVDVAMAFPDDVMSVSSIIPSSLAEAVGKLGMDVELSIYRTNSKHIG